MHLTNEQLNSLETPCLVIDVEVAKKNIAQMQKIADQAQCALRPHIKTHKMGFFAQLQMQAGAKGITCAKVTEAQAMADYGVDDIFIAYPIIGENRIARAIALQKQIKRLILAVDSEAGAKQLNTMAQQNNIIFEVRLEIDTGAGRTGIPMAQAPALALMIAACENLRLTGIYTFKSLLYQGKPTEDNFLAAQEEGEMMAQTAQAICDVGVSIAEISAGSSPTGPYVAQTGKVTEIRPGTYIFKDVMQKVEKVGTLEEIAVKFVATVVSVNHNSYAVIDGGTKTFPTDVPLGIAPGFYTGYATVENKPHLRLSFMNEEHGIITSDNGETGLKVGEKITLLPIHVCTAVNLHNSVYLLENEELRNQKVDARGMLI